MNLYEKVLHSVKKYEEENPSHLVALASVRGGHAQGLVTPESDLDLQFYVVPDFVDVMLGKPLKGSQGSFENGVEYSTRDFTSLLDVFLKTNVDTSQLLWSPVLFSERAPRTGKWLKQRGLRTLSLNKDKLLFSALGNAKHNTKNRLYLDLYYLLSALAVNNFHLGLLSEESLHEMLSNGRTLTTEVDLLKLKMGEDQERGEGLKGRLVREAESVAQKGFPYRDEFEESLLGLEMAMALDLRDLF